MSNLLDEKLSLSLNLNKYSEDDVVDYDEKSKFTSQVIRQTDFASTSFNTNFNSQTLTVYRLIKSRQNSKINHHFDSNHFYNHKSNCNFNTNHFLSQIMSTKKFSIVKTKHDDTFDQFQKITQAFRASIAFPPIGEAHSTENTLDDQYQNDTKISSHIAKLENETSSNNQIIRMTKKKRKKKTAKQQKKVSTLTLHSVFVFLKFYSVFFFFLFYICSYLIYM